MAVHHGGKVGSAAKKLASKSTSKSTTYKIFPFWSHFAKPPIIK